MSTPIPNGDCQSKISLFSSEYLSPFSITDFLEDNPDANEESIHAARVAYQKEHAQTVAEARATCISCPVLDTCGQWIQEQEASVYGVVAGLTEQERRDYLKEPVAEIKPTIVQALARQASAA